MYLRCRISSTVDLSYLSKVAPPGKKSILPEIEHLRRYIVTSITDCLQRSDTHFATVLGHFKRQTSNPLWIDLSVEAKSAPQPTSYGQIWLLKKGRVFKHFLIFSQKRHSFSQICSQICSNFPRYFNLPGCLPGFALWTPRTVIAICTVDRDSCPRCAGWWAACLASAKIKIKQLLDPLVMSK